MLHTFCNINLYATNSIYHFHYRLCRRTLPHNSSTRDLHFDPTLEQNLYHIFILDLISTRNQVLATYVGMFFYFVL